MALKHPDAPGRQAGEHAWPPLFGLEPGHLPRLEKQPAPVHGHEPAGSFRH